MSDRTVWSAPTTYRGVDYLLAAMGVALFGGIAVGVVSALPLRVAAGGGSLLAACLFVVCLVRFPRR